ncbi:uncharacterized protein [Choristoneura fumiferana]|uniref:uncharacterized protein n=1 Tax=Choristoneura fumiferana TaxID=7141 RepID=UPI003D1597E8
MVTITATCVAGEQAKRKEEGKVITKRVKRESALLIDSFPSSTYKTKPDIIYQKVSKTKYRKPSYGAPKTRYGPPKPKYGPPKAKYGPPKPKYRPPKPNYGPPQQNSYSNRKPVKKYRRKPIKATKYNKKKLPISKYGQVKKPYGAAKMPKKPVRPYEETFYAPEPFKEPAGFGEPPKDLGKKYVQPPQQNYAEPPVDSYGIPLKAVNFPTTEQFKSDSYDNIGQQYQSYQSYQQDLNVDNINSYTKNFPIYAKPDPEFEEYRPKYQAVKLDSYSDVYKNTFFNSDLGKQKSKYHFPHSIHKNKPWKSRAKPGTGNDHIVVGGQYAEPPGRLVRQSLPSGPIYDEHDSTYADSEVASSATISPYVNYKHSNMAFSPQNLNDAFSLRK